MSKILGIGIATLDIINYVDSFPEENSEVRAVKQIITRGGNVTNSLCVLSQLNHQTSWCGTLANENDASIILDDLNKYQVNCDLVKTFANGKVPTSYILLNMQNGSRSIVHHRDLPELDFDHFKSISLTDFDWIHFEARNIDQTLKMLQHLKQFHPDIQCSVEFEKQRDGIEQLYELADVLIFSKNYSLSNHQTDPLRFLNTLRQTLTDKTLILAWADQGSYGCTDGSVVHHEAAQRPTNITDTLGAGDTFNAAVIDSILDGCSLQKTLSKANRLAACKIAISGFDLSDYVR
ncbi:MAG: PfkB family carbohydrate kinase [Gammaproteobacteria bacterium]|nr:PfkB family carbohydrate kinase [Gammaproteobacteria bacterium]